MIQKLFNICFNIIFTIYIKIIGYVIYSKGSNIYKIHCGGELFWIIAENEKEAISFIDTKDDNDLIIVEKLSYKDNIKIGCAKFNVIGWLILEDCEKGIIATTLY